MLTGETPRVWDGTLLPTAPVLACELPVGDRKTYSFHELAGGSPVPVVVIYRGQIVYANPACLAAVGASSEGQVLARSPLDFVDPACHADVSERILRVLRGERSDPSEQRFVRLDGTTFEVEVTGWPIPFENATAIQAQFLVTTERKRAERRLSAGNARLKELTQALDLTPVIACNLDGAITQWNRAAEKLYGWTLEEARGRLCHELLSTEFPKPIAAILEELLREGRWSAELAHVRRDGSRVWVASFWALHRDTAGVPKSVILVNHDITARKAVEQELIRSEERLELARSSAGIRIWDWNIREKRGHSFAGFGAIPDESPASAEFLTSSDEWMNTIHPEDIEIVRCWHESALGGELLPDVEFRVTQPDGSIHWMRRRGKVIRDAQGSPVRVLGITMDVTEVRRERESLRKVEELFRVFMQHLPAAAFIKDRAGRCLYANPALERIFETQPGAPANAGANQCWPDLANHFRKTDAKVIQSGKPVVVEETIPVSGALHHFQTVKFPILDAHGNVAVIGGVSMDVTGQKRAHEELRVLSASLITAQEDERRRISRELHDDLTQRLALIAMDLGALTLDNCELPEELKGQLSLLQERIDEASKTTRHLAHRLHPSILDDLGLRVALHSCCEEFEKRHGIAIRYKSRSLPEQLPRDIASGLYRVLQEGLNNAARHSHTRRMSVTVSATPKFIRLCIEDYGIGFDPASPAYRAGLGLVSMKERARALNGRFQLTSNPGAGTRIHVEIPLARAAK